MSMSVLEFTQVARALQTETARLGLNPPAFRSPCHVGPRALKRTSSEQVVVYVSHVGRPAYDVTGDLIEGCLKANGPLLVDEDATELIRSALWVAAGQAVAA